MDCFTIIKTIHFVVRKAMNYCSLDDAFPSSEGVPSPGCTSDQAARAARKEERRKMKRCKQDQDPDRQQYGKLPEVPSMNPGTGLREHAPAYAPQGEMDSQSWNQSMEPFAPMVPLPTPNQPASSIDISQPASLPKKNYFGRDPEDSFADYIPNQKDYELQPDFLGSFEQTGLQKATGKASVLPTPSMNMYWKPTTASGAQTSFIESLPPQKYHQSANPARDPSLQEVMKRMDMLFARLDDLNATTPEQMTSELLMFISSGIFVLFMMDLLVKKGSRMNF
jgi:hypothetical protein